jgi:hypothetical protein
LLGQSIRGVLTFWACRAGRRAPRRGCQPCVSWKVWRHHGPRQTWRISRIAPEVDNFRITLWHELTHRLEDKNGDFTVPRAGERGYGERNTEYMEAIHQALLALRSFEMRLRPGGGSRDPAELRALWQAVERRFLEGSDNEGTRTIDFTTDTLEAWNRFHVHLDELRRHYQNGACGDIPASVFQ